MIVVSSTLFLSLCGLDIGGQYNCGGRVYNAMQIWIDGIGPIAKVIAPLNSEGHQLPLGVRTHGAWIETAWYSGLDEKLPVTKLPPTFHIIKSRGSDWNFIKAGRPDPYSSWEWEWTHDFLKRRLASLLGENSPLFQDIKPIEEEAKWLDMIAISGKGSYWREPLQLQKLADIITKLDLSGRTTYQFRSRTIRNLQGLRDEVNIRLSNGQTSISSPLPGPDIEIHGKNGYWNWEPYSIEKCLERTITVYSAALESYQLVVQRWFSKFVAAMPFAAMLPARVCGRIFKFEHNGMPDMEWYIEALPTNSSNKIDIQILTDNNRLPDDKEIFLQQGRSQFEYRNVSHEWLHRAIYHGLEVFSENPIVTLVTDWLKSDLQSIQWL